MREREREASLGNRSNYFGHSISSNEFLASTISSNKFQLKFFKFFLQNENVERFVVSVDTTLCKRNQLEKLNLISKRIESYDAIESNNDEVDKVSAEGSMAFQSST